MAEAYYTARATTKQQVLIGINKLTLHTNEHGQYTHDAILLIQKGIQRVLVSQFNPSNPGKGMVKLLGDGNIQAFFSFDLRIPVSFIISTLARSIITSGAIASVPITAPTVVAR